MKNAYTYIKWDKSVLLRKALIKNIYKSIKRLEMQRIRPDFSWELLYDDTRK